MSNMATISTFTGPISTVAYRQAKKWSKQQATPEKSLSILLNTLSVSFMNFYLKCIGFETDLEASDSWNPLQQTLMDVADLSIKNLGKLECRPVLENTEFVYVPPEVQSNRIGYVVVQINQSFQSGKLLGFVKEASIDKLPINQLQPLEKFILYLESLELEKTKYKSHKLVSSSQDFVSLKKWFENIFAESWLPVESMFLNEPAWQFRSTEEELVNSVERAKLIDFGIQGKRATVIIVVKASHDKNNFDETKIIVELHPTNGQEYLPSSLHVMILDEEETAVIEAKAKNDNKKIGLQFLGSQGDKFSLKIALGDVSVTENFVI